MARKYTENLVKFLCVGFEISRWTEHVCPGHELKTTVCM